MARRLVIGLMMLSGAVSAPAQAPSPPPPSAAPACTAAEHRQFDFWVGYWDVYRTDKQTLTAHSLVEKLYGGCAIRENWRPLNPASAGGSLSNYVPANGRWVQTWLDAAGSRVQFDGGLVGKRMVLTGYWPGSAPDGGLGLVRMTYTPHAEGSVQQRGEVSTDFGLTWAVSFDFLYRPSKDKPAN